MNELWLDKLDRAKGRNDGSSAVHEVSVNLSLDITAVGHDIIEDLPHHKNDEPLSSALQ